MIKHLAFSIAAALTIGLAPLAKASDFSNPYQAPMYNWTGFYIGANGGYAWGDQDPLNIITDRFDNRNINFSGGLFGGTAGAQIQMAHVVLGVETEIDWANINGSSTIAPMILNKPLGSTFTASTSITSVSTTKLRVGYAQNNWLLFATGGAAILGAKTNLTTVAGPLCGSPAFPNCTGTSHQLAAVAGLGVEYGFAPNWSIKAEYDHITAVSLNVSREDELRLGVNYRFGGN
jgi:outer membrane immunogenic protein